MALTCLKNATKMVKAISNVIKKMEGPLWKTVKNNKNKKESIKSLIS